MKVSLQDVLDAMELSSDESTSYINVKTGEIEMLTDEEVDLVEDEELDEENLAEWLRERLPKVREVLDSDDFLPLPGKFEIHEWKIMERFSISQTNDSVRHELLDAIHGAGAFRSFRGAIRRNDIEDNWFTFRRSALEEIAKEWLTAQDLSFQ
jgi:hypothetical protein